MNKKISMQREKVLITFLCLAQVFFFSSCSVGNDVEMETTHQFNVSVTGEGVKENATSESLVHHVQIPRAGVDGVASAEKPLKAMKVKATPFRDANGGVIGVLLDFRDDDAERSKYLWQHADMVLAINSDLVDNEETFKKFFTSLKEKGNVTLSIQREGVVHKFYYELV